MGRDSGADTVTTLRRCCGKSGCHRARLSEEDDRVRPLGGDELSITINNAAGWMKQPGMASPTIPDKMGSGRSEDLCVRQGENGDVFVV